MKVSELIESLKKLPPDLDVYVEGCDCYRKASGATLNDEENLVTSNSMPFDMPDLCVLINSK